VRDCCPNITDLESHCCADPSTVKRTHDGANFKSLRNTDGYTIECSHDCADRNAHIESNTSANVEAYSKSDFRSDRAPVCTPIRCTNVHT
jgi:hypothetical protein